MNRLLAAIRFLTILPLPGRRGADPADLARGTAMFPVVGLLLGAVAAGAVWLVAPHAPPLVTAAGLVILLAAMSGCLHLDGLSDTADGLLSSRPRQQMLEIMKDSRTGAMGVIALLAVLLVKFAALASLASLGAAELWPAAALMPLAGRCAMLVHMAIMPAARPGGLGAVFCGRPRAWAIALWAAAILAVAGWLVADLPGLVAWVASAAVTLLTAAYFYRKIGGATGDTLGAVCEIVETVPAISLALWPAHATLLAH